MAQPTSTPTRARFFPTAGVRTGGSGGERTSGRLAACAEASGSPDNRRTAGAGTTPPVTARAARMAAVIRGGCVKVSSKAQRDRSVRRGRARSSLMRSRAVSRMRP